MLHNLLYCSNTLQSNDCICLLCHLIKNKTSLHTKVVIVNQRVCVLKKSVGYVDYYCFKVCLSVCLFVSTMVRQNEVLRVKEVLSFVYSLVYGRHSQEVSSTGVVVKHIYQEAAIQFGLNPTRTTFFSQLIDCLRYQNQSSFFESQKLKTVITSIQLLY